MSSPEEQSSESIFPHPSNANKEGLLAVGGDLSVEMLLEAYSKGIFPWYSEGQPILWWSPDPRLVLRPSEFKISKSLAQRIKAGRYECRIDTAFENVIRACSNIPRQDQDGTWITEDMIEAYIELHRLGYAHSVEIYYPVEDGSGAKPASKGAGESAGHTTLKLAGGLYGVSLGGSFFGESMFSHKRDASKLALYHLAELAKKWEFDMIDAQTPTDHLKSLGAKELPRLKFLRLLKISVKRPTKKGLWKP